VTYDPYYVHYLLLVQSIKINNDVEEWNRIDMKARYEQMLEVEQVPLH
jgi:hypothetical protein